MDGYVDRGYEDGYDVHVDKILNQINDSHIACEIKKKFSGPNNGCGVLFDSVLCWPQTPPNTLAVLPCFSQLNGIHYDTSNNATRFCLPNGTWDQYTDYTNCTELMLEGTEVELTTTIYFVGYTISLVGLIIAVYIFWRFKDLRCLRNSIHMNLMISYILADFVWILTYSVQVSMPSSKVSCVLLILLLHYLHLTNFFWMFVEGLYLYILVVKTFTGENIKLRIYAIIGWGGPVLFVLLWGVAKSFTISTDDQQTTGIKNCPWRPHAFDWIYQVPAIIVLIANLIFLLIIMWVLITKLRSATNVETQQYRKAAKALLVLIPLLGVTYILVIVGPTHPGMSRSIYECIRAVLLSTQGFSVALFYCFLNAEVKNTLKHHFNSWHTTRSLGSRRTRYSSRDWSPRSRDSLRLSGSFFKKRESTGSVGTTTTLVSIPIGKGSSSQHARCPLLPSGDNG